MAKQATATVLQHPGAKGHRLSSPVSTSKPKPAGTTKSTTPKSAGALVPGQKKRPFKEQFIPDADDIHGLKVDGTAGEIREYYLLGKKIKALEAKQETLKQSIKVSMLGCKAEKVKTTLGELTLISRTQKGRTQDVIDAGLLLDEGIEARVIEKCTRKGKETLALYVEEA
jgi:hypothetical protein